MHAGLSFYFRFNLETYVTTPTYHLTRESPEEVRHSFHVIKSYSDHTQCTILYGSVGVE